LDDETTGSSGLMRNYGLSTRTCLCLPRPRTRSSSPTGRGSRLTSLHDQASSSRNECASIGYLHRITRGSLPMQSPSRGIDSITEPESIAIRLERARLGVEFGFCHPRRKSLAAMPQPADFAAVTISWGRACCGSTNQHSVVLPISLLVAHTAHSLISGYPRPQLIPESHD